ncbi:hypothetical protein LshimejAT787_4500070 [Lyophyllum shimeji]|uniref:Uncharacterized protein n=1 Tax=Lyophyllum shimeji TaxID=47721 RepID=A0A9P3US79_LYOSH|nr:hypothetical protein LshimejAT787_4500070 [Lyophyllum shimeji]
MGGPIAELAVGGDVARTMELFPAYQLNFERQYQPPLFPRPTSTTPPAVPTIKPSTTSPSMSTQNSISASSNGASLARVSKRFIASRASAKFALPLRALPSH